MFGMMIMMIKIMIINTRSKLFETIMKVTNKMQLYRLIYYS